MPTVLLTSVLSLPAAAATGASADGPTEAEQRFAEHTAQLAEQADGEQAQVVVGSDGYLFFAPELRHLGLGRFWGERAIEVSRARNPDWADPLPAIVDFHEQAQRAGVELIFVPIPAKATIYPDKLPDAPSSDEPARLDPAHRAFLDALRGHGVTVIDLTADFLAHRAATDDAEAQRLYCKQDTHFSPRGAELAADRLATLIAAHGWLDDDEPGRAYRTRELELTIDGDLRQMLGDPDLPRETLRANQVIDHATNAPPEPDRDSPVLLLADSHGLAFHAGGDMHASGAGLVDHLAARLGLPLDLIAVRGSGATPSRLQLLRRRDELAGKRVVIWCLSVREYTQGDGWRRVPVVPERPDDAPR
ncbi:MAG: hypothetical protein WD009_12535 [Phycisphaeraceae bacterium]